MFERYTEKARRVIFFARYEASSLGSPYIETEHLLLGLLREDRTLANSFLKSHAAVDSIRRQVEEHTPVREKIATSVDLPLSHECKRVLALAAEEAERFEHKHLGPIHLLAGLLLQETGFAAEILNAKDVRISTVREELESEKPEPPTKASWMAHRAAIESHRPILDIAFEMHAEIERQARDRGMKTREYLRSLLEKALNPPPVPVADRAAPDSLRETYHRLRSRIEAEGLPCLDAAELEQEIARRKGARGAS